MLFSFLMTLFLSHAYVYPYCSFVQRVCTPCPLKLVSTVRIALGSEYPVYFPKTYVASFFLPFLLI